jgi:hypothetical protein
MFEDDNCQYQPGHRRIGQPFDDTYDHLHLTIFLQLLVPQFHSFRLHFLPFELVQLNQQIVDAIQQFVHSSKFLYHCQSRHEEYVNFNC